MKRILMEDETKKILEKYGIPIPPEARAKSEEEAVIFAREIGYPVVLKLLSPDILHRSDVNCILKDINSDEEVRQGYRKILKNAKELKEGAKVNGVLVQKMMPQGKEVVLGLVKDDKFGRIVVFGLGGMFIEILKDISFRVAPVTKEEALKMMKEIKNYKILEGVGDEKISDVEAIADVITKISKLGIEKEEVVEMDINPLFVYEKGVVAIDALMILE